VMRMSFSLNKPGAIVALLLSFAVGLGSVEAKPEGEKVQGGKTCSSDQDKTCRDGVEQYQDKPAREVLREEDEREAKHLGGILEKQEIPKLRIGWRINDTIAAYYAALHAKKPLVLLFHSRNCIFCNRLLARFSCPEINRFASRAVFAVTIPRIDEGGKMLFDAAELKAYPAIVVFHPERDRLFIAGVATGELGLDQLEKFLNDSFAVSYRAENRAEPDDLRGVLSVSDLALEYQKLGLAWSIPAECGP
jgi:hypothetical protein